MTGGRTLRIPILERVQWLTLGTIPLDINVADAYSKGNIPLAVQAIKRIVKTGSAMPVEYAERFAEPIGALINQSEDRLEGPRSFAEKRAANWKMR